MLANMNNPPIRSFDARASTQEVNGQSLFWIVLTLATTALTQPSIRARYGTPYRLARSMPFYCFSDAIIDLTTITRSFLARRRGEHLILTQRDHNWSLDPRSVTFKLLIIIFGIVPQAIKVFSMRGIPMTQICAACFISGTLTGMLADLTRISVQQYFARPQNSNFFFQIYFYYLLFGGIHIGPWVWGRIMHFTIPTPWYDPDMYLRVNASLMFGNIAIFMFILPLINYVRGRQGLKERLKSLTGIYIAAGIHYSLSLFDSKRISPRGEPSEYQTFFNGQILGLVMLPLSVKLSIALARFFISLKKRMANPAHSSPDSPDLQPSSTSTSVPLQHHDSQAAHPPTTSGLPAVEIAPEEPGWIVRIIQTPAEIADVAFAIYMLMVTSLYYLVAFDGTGTTSPDWLRYLGR